MIEQLDPIVIDTRLQQIKLRWNPSGSILAVAGYFPDKYSTKEDKGTNAVQFYSASGDVRRIIIAYE